MNHKEKTLHNIWNHYQHKKKRIAWYARNIVVKMWIQDEYALSWEKSCSSTIILEMGKGEKGVNCKAFLQECLHFFQV